MANFFSDFLRWSIFLFFYIYVQFCFCSYGLFIIKNKINVAKHENSKWRPNLRWTLKRFYRLSLCIWFFLGLFKFGYTIFYTKSGRKIQYGRFFANKSRFLCSGTAYWNVIIRYVILLILFYSKIKKPKEKPICTKKKFRQLPSAPKSLAPHFYPFRST
jgi:hypothetical protein